MGRAAGVVFRLSNFRGQSVLLSRYLHSVTFKFAFKWNKRDGFEGTRDARTSERKAKAEMATTVSIMLSGPAHALECKSGVIFSPKPGKNAQK